MEHNRGSKERLIGPRRDTGPAGLSSPWSDQRACSREKWWQGTALLKRCIEIISAMAAASLGISWPLFRMFLFFDQQQKNRDNMDPLVFWQNVAQFKAWEGIWVCPHLSSNHSNASVFVWTPQSRTQVWTSTQIQTLVEGETTCICQAWEQMSMNYRKPGLILIPQSFKDSAGGYLTKIYLIKDLKIGSDEQVECTAKKNGYFSFHVHLGMKRFCGWKEK